MTGSPAGIRPAGPRGIRSILVLLVGAWLAPSPAPPLRVRGRRRGRQLARDADGARAGGELPDGEPRRRADAPGGRSPPPGHAHPGLPHRRDGGHPEAVAGLDAGEPQPAEGRRPAGDVRVVEGRAGVLPRAVGEGGGPLPPAHRGGVGVRLPGRRGRSAGGRRRPGCRGLVRGEQRRHDARGRVEDGERLGPSRHARERGRVDAGRLRPLPAASRRTRTPRGLPPARRGSSAAAPAAASGRRCAARPGPARRSRTSSRTSACASWPTTEAGPAPSASACCGRTRPSCRRPSSRCRRPPARPSPAGGRPSVPGLPTAP